MGSIMIFLSRKNRKGKSHHMLNKNSIKTILNVKHTCIDKVTMLADTSIMIEVHATKGEQCRCGICGKKSKFYDNGNEGARTWRACDWAGHKVILVGPSCRVNCKEHGVVTCRFPWARHGSRFTRKFEEQTAWMAVNCSRVAVAAFMRISWNTVGPIIERVEKDFDINPNARFDNLVRIGVDETSYRKGHKYITTVVNHDTGNVIWVAKGHGKTIFEQFFKLLTPEQRNSIQLVSGDGAKWIDECIKEYCPNANRCVDPFHVIEWAMDALDSVRVDAWREAKAATKEQPKAKIGRPKKGTPSKDTTATELKNSKMALGKAPSNLTPNQQAKVKWIAKTDPRLYRAYKLNTTGDIVSVIGTVRDDHTWVETYEGTEYDFVKLSNRYYVYQKAFKAGSYQYKTVFNHKDWAGWDNITLKLLNSKVVTYFSPFRLLFTSIYGNKLSSLTIKEFINVLLDMIPSHLFNFCKFTSPCPTMAIVCFLESKAATTGIPDSI